MKRVAIVDYGMGNLRSVAKAVERVASDVQVCVTADAATIAAAERVIVPGQGAMPDCMREIDRLGLRPALLEAAAQKPFLGICIGLQMLFEHSEEGDVAGLGLLPGRVRRFPASLTDASGIPLKVPHMGWNVVEQVRAHPLWEGIATRERFYFVHSYYVSPARAEDIAGSTEYGLVFTSAIAHANIFAVQFHPEKSALSGLRLLANFMRWAP
ncbi:MAG: imidazole glycerol phosphate synthase subunit HisH [Rhodocyclaceae bacterium]|nr:imidazole glycerol phosphate synthase subunit HisH [Rhodocyclaceae bacterium]